MVKADSVFSIPTGGTLTKGSQGQRISLQLAESVHPAGTEQQECRVARSVQHAIARPSE